MAIPVKYGNSGQHEDSALRQAIRDSQAVIQYLPASLKIQHGLAATTVSGSTATAHVTFDPEFETAPNVVCSVQGTSTNMFEARPYNVAVDGFDIISLRNVSGTISPVAVNVHWIAVGV